ncbi:MAG: SRPBCC domain-containing protein [Flavobacteriales bacterium]
MENFDRTRSATHSAVRAKLSDMYRGCWSSSAIEQWFMSWAINRDADDEDLGPDTAMSEDCSYTWRWCGYGGVEHGRTNKANGVYHLQFNFVGDRTVYLRMREEDERLIEELVRSKIPQDEKSKRDIRLGSDPGRSFCIVDLKSLLEGGLAIGTRKPR